MLVEFEVAYDEGWWSAYASRDDGTIHNTIVTDGKTLDELIENIREAVSLCYEDDERIEAGEQITVRFQVEIQVDPAIVPS